MLCFLLSSFVISYFFFVGFHYCYCCWCYFVSFVRSSAPSLSFILCHIYSRFSSSTKNKYITPIVTTYVMLLLLPHLCSIAYSSNEKKRITNENREKPGHMDKKKNVETTKKRVKIYHWSRVMNTFYK